MYVLTASFLNQLIIYGISRDFGFERSEDSKFENSQRSTVNRNLKGGGNWRTMHREVSTTIVLKPPLLWLNGFISLRTTIQVIAWNVFPVHCAGIAI